MISQRIEPHPGYAPTIGRLVAMLTFARATTVEAVEGLSMAELDHLHEPAVRRLPGEPEAELGQDVAVGVAHLPAVAVPLADLGGAVGLGHLGAGPEPG